MARSTTMLCLRRGYAAISAAVSLTTVLALARAGDFVGEATRTSCGDMWDSIRWSFMVVSCRLSDVNQFDILNGGVVLLAMLAALNPTLLAFRIALLILVLEYLGDAKETYTEHITRGHISPGLELWWVPIFYLSILILIVAIVTAVFTFAKRWRGPSGAARRAPHASGANRTEGSG